MSEDFAQELSHQALYRMYASFENRIKKLIDDINGYTDKILDKDDVRYNEANYEYIDKIRVYISFLESSCLDFFSKNKKYLLNQVVGRKFEDYILDVQNRLIAYGNRFDSESVHKVTVSILDLVQAYETITEIANKENQANQLINELRAQVAKATDTVKSVVSAKEALESKPTEVIYSEASLRYLEAARNYEWTFYLIFIAAIIVTIVSFIHFPYSTTDIVDFILYKVLTVSVVITFGTIFLRKASHLRKLHDQAHQTSMELQALPLYLKNVKSDDHSEIYKNLAEKYFGKEIDQTQNDKIGDLLQDQVKISTELIKASAEMVKSVKPSGASESSEPK